jgi:hypothetical protein
MNIYLFFTVDKQVITRVDKNILAAKSQNYIKARFNFSIEWESISKTAQFTKGENTYNVAISSAGTCTVPWEALTSSGILKVSVFGDDLITTNYSSIPIKESGYVDDGEFPLDPTPSYFAEIQENEEQRIANENERIANDADRMLKSTYDPNTVGSDVFDMDNMVEGATTKIMTNAERLKLSGIENLAKDDQDADEVPYNNSASELVAENVQDAVDESYVKNKIIVSETQPTNGWWIEEII